jgi:hypothetical protein
MEHGKVSAWVTVRLRVGFEHCCHDCGAKVKQTGNNRAGAADRHKGVLSTF